MQLVLERPDFEYVLQAADGHSAKVNQRLLQNSFIITPQALIEDWAPRSLAEVDVAALQPVLELKPDLVILGTGANQGFANPEAAASLLRHGIGLECMTNAAAARTYTVLAAEARRVVGCFLLETDDR